MKKTLTITILCISFIAIYLLQINLFSWFTIAGVRPNLFVILVLFIGLYTGRRYGAILGAIFGLGIDLLRRQQNRTNRNNTWNNRLFTEAT